MNGLIRLHMTVGLLENGSWTYLVYKIHKSSSSNNNKPDRRRRQMSSTNTDAVPGTSATDVQTPTPEETANQTGDNL